jgi:DNA helicase-2/ATP-dependent DNA helicase PcrA
VHPIVREELELLDRVLRALEEPEPDGLGTEAALVAELQRLRELLVDRQEEKDRPALLDQWNRHAALLEHVRRSQRRTRVERDSPYFAHLRLREGAAERDLCLGRATWLRGGVRVVDWRHAPVSRIFYRYRQGESYEEEFGGRTAAGEVVARRTVVVRGERLERVDAPEASFLRAGDGAWEHLAPARRRLAGGQGAALRAHGRAGGVAQRLGTDPTGARQRLDKRLPEIAALLDAEQFEVIARPAPGVLVVKGSAGSGKTTVALHRIAYLAHDDPRIDAPSTLFLTFSPALRDYVAHVLPALGVSKVQLATWAEWAARERARLYPALPVAPREDTPAALRRVKLHPALAAALAARVERVPGPRSAEQAFDDWASVLTDGALLREFFDRAGDPATGALRATLEWSRLRLDELGAWLAGERDVEAALDPEDDALLLRAWQLRVGPLGRGGDPLRYRHLAVDEVQDFAPVELRVLLDCLAEPASVTLAGDLQQRIVAEIGFGSWEELLEGVGTQDAETTALRVSYRSTREIMAFAHGVLGPLGEEDAPPETPRAGPPVETFEFTDAGSCVAFLADALLELAVAEPLASVAVLTPSRAATALYHEGLARAEVPRLRRVEHWDFSFAPGVEVAEIEQAKGLEFDYVILVDAGASHFPATPAARRALHVGATRAVHQLWVTSAGAPSPLVRDSGGRQGGA